MDCNQYKAMENEYMEVPGEIIGEEIIFTGGGVQTLRKVHFNSYPAAAGGAKSIPISPAPCWPARTTAAPNTLGPIITTTSSFDGLDTEPVLANMAICLSQQLTNLSVSFSAAVGKSVHYRIEADERNGLNLVMSLWVRCDELEKNFQLFTESRNMFDSSGRPIPKQLLWRITFNELMNSVLLHGLARATRQVLELEDEIVL